MNRSQITFHVLGTKYGFNLANMVKFVNENQYWSTDQIYHYQLKMLKSQIEHVYANVAYYRRIMKDLGIEPGDFSTIEDIRHFPIIGKEQIMAEFDSFLADDYLKYHPMERSTGGTTGIPFKYFNDTASWGLNWATKIRTFSWGGYRLGTEKLAELKGGSMARKGSFSPQTMFWKYLLNYYSIPIINMDSHTMGFHFRQIVKKDIRFIRGYPSALYTFAKYLEANNVIYPMKGIFTTAEMLYDYQRKLIEKVFDNHILDQYGCGEGMGGANQCEVHRGYHVNIETSYLELVDNNGYPSQKGKEGEIVLTSLQDYSMPFIRYKPGDMAIMSTSRCGCGRTLPLLDKIIGRTSDLIELPNGRTLNGLSIPFEAWSDKIDRFQLVQEEKDLLVLNLVPKAGFTDSDERQIRELLVHNAGPDIRVVLEKVAHIDQSSAGKFRYVISKVK